MIVHANKARESIIQSVEAAFTFFNNLRFCTSVTVARNLNLEVTVFARNGFFGSPVAAIAVLFGGLFIAFFLAEMMRHFGTHCPFEQGFGELFEQSVFADEVFRVPVTFNRET